jgi:hypothetical protein
MASMPTVKTSPIPPSTGILCIVIPGCTVVPPVWKYPALPRASQASLFQTAPLPPVRGRVGAIWEPCIMDGWIG